MSDQYRPGTAVPVEAVMVLDTQYRIVFQEMTSWRTPSDFSMTHDLGIVTLAYARTELAAHRLNIKDRMVIWLEQSPIGPEVWVKVPDAQ